MALPERERKRKWKSPHPIICMSNGSPLHWQSARPGWMTAHLTAEWCQIAPVHNRAGREAEGSEGSAVPSGEQRCKSAMAIEMLHPWTLSLKPHGPVGSSLLSANVLPLCSLIRAAGRDAWHPQHRPPRFFFCRWFHVTVIIGCCHPPESVSVFLCANFFCGKLSFRDG